MRRGWILGILASMLVGCGSEAVQMAGGSSEQGNALQAIQILVVDRHGAPTPATIELLPADWSPNKDTAGFTSGPLGQGQSWLSPSLPQGSYSILAIGDSGKRIHSMELTGNRKDTIQLEPTVRMQGTFPAGSSVQIPGARISAVTDAKGLLVFDSLPVGAKRLLIRKDSTTGVLFLDSLYPSTQIYLTAYPKLSAPGPARLDSTWLTPPNVYPPAGNYQAQVTIATWHPLREATFERAPTASGPWSSFAGGIALDSSANLWLRSRVAKGYVSQPRLYSYSIAQAIRTDSSLPVIHTAPVGPFSTFMPDSIRKNEDTIHIFILTQGCSSLPAHGFGGWVHSDSLGLYRRICNQPTAPTKFHFTMQGASAIRWAHTLMPKGVTYALP
ncbi:MAG: hypothetical protein RL318_2511 [Fibrobacterota bacterium]|jgi:hypothetical protein